MDKLREFLEKKKEKSSSRRPRYGTRKLSVGLVSCVLGYCIFLSPSVVNAQVGEGASEPTSSTSTEASAVTSASGTESGSAETKAVDNGSADKVEKSESTVQTDAKEEITKKTEAPATETPVVEAEKEAPAEEVTEKDEIKETTEAETPAVAEEVVEDEAEEKSEPVAKEEAETEKLVANKEANIEETVAADKKENKTEETTPKAEENKDALKSEDDKEAIVEDEKVEETEAAKVEKTETQAEPTSKEVANEELLLNEKPEPEALQAGETEEDAITNVEITIGGAKNGEKTEIVNPTALPKRTNEGNTDINLEARVDFDIPEGTKAGRTFDFEVSDNVNLHGILVDEDKAVPVEYDGVEIATGTKLTDGRRGYRYTFNKNVDGLKDIRVRILYPLWIDPDKVPLNSEKETVTVKVAGKQASKDYKIEYENVVSEDKLGSTTLSGIANIEEVTSNSYEHIIYVNPRGDQGLINSNVTIENDVDHDSATFDEDVKNSVEVYRVKDSDKLPLSFGNNFEDGNYEKVENAEVKLVADGSKNKLVVKVNQGDAKNYFKDDAYDKSAYIIKYKGKRTPEKETKTKITYKADRRLLNGKKESLVTDGRFAWTWTNEIVFDDADAIALANKTYSLGDRVWIDADGDGSQGDSEKGLAGVKVILKGINMSDKETTTDAKGNYKFEGLRNGEYTVEFEIPSGYAPTTANKDGVTDEVNSDASQAEGAKVATATGIINGANNMNVDFGVIESEQTGSFIEHHIYITKDKDGKETSRKVEDGKLQEGYKDQSYTTGKVEKDGFKFVRTEKPVNEPTFDEKGAETKGNYKQGVKQEITYVYEKTEAELTPLTPAEEPGSFQEHHIYEVYKDGKLVERSEITLEETTGTSKEYFTTSAKPNGTKDQPKEGFKLVKELISKSIGVESHLTGEEIKEHYKNNEKLEVRYVYRKDITTPTTPEIPWTPLEPSEPVTPVEPEQPGTPEQPNKPVRQSKKLPKAGADYELLKLAAGALSIVSGFGLSLGRKKED